MPKIKVTMQCMCVSVRGAILNLQSQRSNKTGWDDDAGRPLNKREAINSSMDELSQGRETLPMNPKCANPCQNSPLCKGFDFGKNGGCPGYLVEPPTEKPVEVLLEKTA